MTPNLDDTRMISARTWEVVSTGLNGPEVKIIGFDADGNEALGALQFMAHNGASRGRSASTDDPSVLRAVSY
jgi:hypothetical protein